MPSVPVPSRPNCGWPANPADDPRTTALVESVPVGRMGEPRDIANAVAFFMDERSSFVTGQILYVCGGITRRPRRRLARFRVGREPLRFAETPVTAP